MDKDQLTQQIIAGAMVAIMAATVRALLVKTETLNEKIRTWAAGVLLGTLAAYLFRSLPVSDFWKEVIIAGLAAFVATVYPILERKFLTYVRKTNEPKEDNNVLPDNDN